jgi:peptidoglycan/xylan/chitin deacetylase (PgdA/CDA1 family)
MGILSFPRRGFLKGLGAAGAAVMSGGRMQTAFAQERSAPGGRGGATSASSGASRAIRGSELPAEHFNIRHNPIKWPNNARIAVCWVVNFECYSDTSDSFDIPHKDYSSKAAFRRLVNLFGTYDIKADWYTNGLIATRYPDTLKELARLGHGFVGHNFANNVSMVNATEDQEHELIKRTLGDMEKVSGVRPLGWFGSGGAGTAKTFEFLAEEGVIWTSDYASDDVPYVVPAGSKKLVLIPYEREANDTQTYGTNRLHPNALLQRFKDQFDLLYAEGATYPQMLFLSMHAWLTGHPVGKKELEATIQYVKGFPDVWLTTETDIAKWWIDQKYT